MQIDEHLSAAARAIDQALAERPTHDGTLFSTAAQNLSAARDQMARTGADRRPLEHVNAVISVVLACHFPIGPIPWGELEKSRAWLGAIA